MTYTVRISCHAQKALESISKKDARRIAEAIDQLANDPRPRWSLKLKGYDAHRIAVGDYRVIFEICDKKKTVDVVKISDRKDIYRGL
jgi:mRNA interferase RelE/StbE